MNKIKLSFKQKFAATIFILVMFLLLLTTLYFIFGNLLDAFQIMKEYTGMPNKTADAVSSLTDILTVFIAFFTLIATVFFSYLVWKVSEGSRRISESLNQLEIDRDAEIPRENALIVYYDLQRGISNIRDLYISVCIKNEKPNQKRLFLSQDWVKNVANLRSGLSNKDIETVYDLYNKFFTIQNLLENEKYPELKATLDSISRDIFADFIPLQILNKVDVDLPEDLIDIDLYILLKKIYLMTFSKHQVERITETDAEGNVKPKYKVLVDNVIFYKGNLDEYFDGNGELYNSLGKLKCSGDFKKGAFISGTVKGYSVEDEEGERIGYEIILSDRKVVSGFLKHNNLQAKNRYIFKGSFYEGKIINGFTTTFFENGRIHYYGKITNGLKEGEGMLFDEDGNLRYEGLWINDHFHKGTIYNSKTESFTGEFRNDKPWSGTAKNYNGFEDIKEFTGEVKEGEPFSGKGLHYKRNSIPDDSWYYYPVEDPEYYEEIEQFAKEHQHICKNERIRENYAYWEEFIKATWDNGEIQFADDEETNIYLFYDPNTFIPPALKDEP